MTFLFSLLLAVAGTRTSHVTVQGQARRFLIHVPANAPKPAPLVLVFHGGTDTPENMEKISGFSTLSDREGFIVAYPEGVEKSWNDGRGTTPAAKSNVDDVAFTRAVIADIQSHYAIDPKRIYATGPSNGGIFVSRLACEMSNTLAAIGPVIGTIASSLAGRCHPAQPISVVGVQGVADPLVPFAGGEEGGTQHLGHGGRVEGSRATQLLFAQLNGCYNEAVSRSLPSRVNDGTSVTRRSYGGCNGHTEVTWYEIEGGGHRWPPHQLRPAAEAVARRAFGVSSQNIDAAEVLWAFFKAHPKR